MRKQFTFYRSYYEAVVDLPKREQLSLLLAICEYALDEKQPSLTGAARGMFRLIQPTLDSSAAKAESGKKGGSKREASDKQTAREKENEDEKEKEKEIENECYSPNPPLDEISGEAGAALSEWLRYKAERGEPYKPQGLTAFLNTVRKNIQAHGADAVAAVIRDSMASGYHGVTWDRVRGMPQNAESRQHAFDEMVAEFMAEEDAS